MKNPFIILAVLLAIAVSVIAQPQIKNPSLYPGQTVKMFDQMEIRFTLQNYSNNYNPKIIKVDAEFISPSGKRYVVPGFYFQDYKKMADKPCDMPMECEELKKASNQPYNWAVRFSPNEKGKWTYKLTAVDLKGEGSWPTNITGIFTCQSSKKDGYFSLSNKRYLKKGEEQLFLIGPNLCWYDRTDYCEPKANYGELGVAEFKKYIDSLANYNVNVIRVWLDNPIGMALVGREWTTLKMHGFNDYNQKDAWQLDKIIAYADSKGINVILTLMNQNTFVNFYCIDNWNRNNAFNKAIKDNKGKGISTPFEIFYNPDAVQKTRDMFRYIIARWGSNTNIVAWELWNEVEQIRKIWGEKKMPISPSKYYNYVAKWHKDMASYIRKNDPYNHLITTSSPNRYTSGGKEFPGVFYDMDFTISHDYRYFESLTDKNNFQNHMLNRANGFYTEPGLENKPYMSQEWGIKTDKGIAKVDPYGFGYHSCLWTSSMSGALGSIMAMDWPIIYEQDQIKEYEPLNKFMNNILPQLKGSNTGKKLETNGMSVFYMIDGQSKLIAGWCQDDAYEYSAIKDSKYIRNPKTATKPQVKSSKNNISIPVKENNIKYTISWYDTKNANRITQTEAISKGKKVTINMPSSLRSSTFGDGAFIIQKKEENTQTKKTKEKYKQKEKTKESGNLTDDKPSEKIKLSEKK